VGLLTLLLIFPIQARAVGKEEKNIIVIGWDAAERSRTKELLKKGELPNLAALIREGKLLDIDVVTGATDTKAGWTQLLTGYVPEKPGFTIMVVTNRSRKDIRCSSGWRIFSARTTSIRWRS